jgi:hypothetical protein
MRTLVCVMIVVAGGLAGCARRESCRTPPRLPAGAPPRPLTAGHYQLDAVATCGPAEGTELSGYLVLLDVPPPRPEPPPEGVDPEAYLREWEPQEFYNLLRGWTDVPFGRLGATVSDEALASRHPLNAGVVVEVIDLPVIRKIDPSTAGHPPDIRLGWPGDVIPHVSGVHFQLQSWDGRCHRGAWSGSAYVGDGTGRILLCPVSPTGKPLTR